jgi:ribosome-associated translation inhibitor RaiA
MVTRLAPFSKEVLMNMRVLFRNMADSDLIRSVVLERFQQTAERFPDLTGHRLTLSLTMENSPRQAGPDAFTVELSIAGTKYRNLRLRRTADNLYVAIAEVHDRALERLNRAGDKLRVRSRNVERRWKRDLAAA